MLSDIFAALEAGMRRPDLTVDGPGTSSDHDAPPRISWEPISATHGPGHELEGRDGREATLWTREVTINVGIWGTSLADTEALLEAFVNAVDRTISTPSYRLNGETWHAGGVTSLGAVVELRLVLRLPLARATKPTTTIGEVSASYKLNETAV